MNLWLYGTCFTMHTLNVDTGKWTEKVIPNEYVHISHDESIVVKPDLINMTCLGDKRLKLYSPLTGETGEVEGELLPKILRTYPTYSTNEEV